MKRKPFILLVSILAICISLFSVSCKEEIAAPPVSYDSPTAIGKVELPAGSGVGFEDIYIRVEDTGLDYKVSSDGSYEITNLEAGKAYTLLFCNNAFAPSSSKALVKAPETISLKNVEDSLDGVFGAVVANAKAATGKGYDNGVARLKKTAAIYGKISAEGITSDLSGIDVSIPGTPYRSQTAKDGTFAISGISERLDYSLSIEYPGYLSKSIGGINVIIDENKVNITDLGDISIKKAEGAVSGSISLNSEILDETILEKISVKAVSVSDPTYVKNAEVSGLDYSISGLAGGSYRIEISFPGFRTYVTDAFDVVLGEEIPLPEVVLEGAGGAISGKISLLYGSDFSGTRITAVSTDGKVRYTTYTEVDGNFRIDNVKVGSYVLSIARDDYGSTEKKVEVLENKDASPVAFVLKSGTVTINGLVSLDTGRKAGGVSVTAEHESGTSRTVMTDPQGRYEIPSSIPGRYVLTFKLNGFDDLVLSDVYVMNDNEDVVHDVMMTCRLGSLSGNIRLSDARTADIEMSVCHESGLNSSVKVNPDGSYLINNLLDGTYSVTVKAPMCDDYSGTVEVKRNNIEDMNITLESVCGSIAGTITFSDNKIPEDKNVTVVHESGLTLSSPIDDKGNYSIPYCPEGSCKLTVRATGYAALEQNMTVARNKPHEFSRMMDATVGSIEGSVVIAGEVIDPTIYNDITLQLISESGDGISYKGNVTEGHFFISGITEGNYTLKAILRDHEDVTIPGIFISAGEHVNMPTAVEFMPKGNAIKGKVTLQYGSDFSGITVIATRTDGLIRYVAHTDAEGLYELPLCMKGSYHVAFSKEDYGSIVKDVTVDESRPAEISFQLGTGTAELTGTVTTDNGNIPDNVTVKLTHESGAEKSVLSGNDGKFVIASCIPGNYTIEFSKDGYETAVAESVFISQNGKNIYDMELKTVYGTIYGQADFGQYPMPYKVVVKAVHAITGEVKEIDCYRDGSFMITDCPEGDYTITIDAGSFTASEATCNVRRNKTERVEFKMLKTTGSVEGTVDINGEVLKDEIYNGVKLELRGENGRKYLTNLDSRRHFMFDDVIEGTYSLEISLAGYKPVVENSIIVTAGKPHVVSDSLVLVADGGEVNGKVTLRYGSDFSDISVRATHKDGSIRYVANTDSNGTYSIPDCVPGTYDVQFSKLDYGIANKEILVRKGRISPINFVLETGTGTISGMISTDNSESAEGASISFTHESGVVKVAVADSTGAYSIDGCIPGTYVMNVSKPGFDDIEIGNLFVTDKRENVFNATLEGNVGNMLVHLDFGKYEMPQGGTARITSLATRNVYTVSVASDGSIKKNGIPHGRYTVAVDVDGFSHEPIDLLIERNDTTELNVAMLRESGSISGSVLILGNVIDESLYNKVRIEIVGSAVNYPATMTGHSYSADWIRTGTYTVKAYLDGHLTAEVSGVEVSSDGSVVAPQLQLAPDGNSITGNVKLIYGSDFSGITVTALKSDNTLSYTTHTDRSGNFELPNCVPGRYVISFAKADYGSAEKTVDVRKNMPATVSFTLQSGLGDISGNVEVNDGKSTSGITVELKHESGITKSTVTDYYGSYSFASCVPGTYTITFSKEGYDKKVISGYFLSDKAPNELDARLERNLGNLSVSLDFGAYPVPELIKVRLTNTATAVSQDLTVSKSYTLQVPDLAEGAYVLEVESSMFKSGKVDVSIERNATKEITVPMSRIVGSVTGSLKVRGDVVNPAHYSNVKVQLVSPEGNTYDGTVSGTGFTVENVLPGTYTVKVNLGGYKENTDKTVNVNSDAVTPVSGVIELVADGGAISGLITLEFGSDFRNIDIVAEKKDGSISYKTKTDGTGSFRISDMEVGSYDVTVSKTGIGSMTTAASVSRNGDFRIEALLSSSGSTLSGKVTLNNGKIPSGINVSIRHENGSEKNTVTDIEGTYSFNNCLLGTYTVTFSKEGYDSKSFDNVMVSQAGARQDVELENNLGSISGTVTFGSKPVPEKVSVTIRHEKSQKIWQRDAGSTGTFTLVDCPEGRYTVEVTADNYSKQTSKPQEVVRDRNTEFNVSMESSVGSLTGSVHINGAEVAESRYADVIVSLVNEGVGLSPDPVSLTGHGFSFENVRPGMYRAEVALSGYVTALVEHVEIKAGDNRFLSGNVELLADGGAISGNVSLEYGSDFSGIKVTATKTDDAVSYVTHTAVDGSYAFTSMEVGAYKVEFMKAGVSSVSKDAVVPKGGNQIITFTLESGKHTLSGTVSTDNARSAAGVSVLIVHEKGFSQSTVTDEFGAYSITNCLLGRYDITFSKAGYDEKVVRNVQVTRDGSNKCDVQLANNLGNISGTVAFDATLVPDQVDVRIIHVPTSQEWNRKVSGAPGTFSLEDCPEGEYRIEVSADRFARETLTRIVKRNNTAHFAFNLSKSIGSYEGEVRIRAELFNEAIYDEVDVKLIGPGGVYTSKLINHRFLIEDIIGGTYRLEVSLPGYVTAVIDAVEIAPGQHNVQSGAVELIADGGALIGKLRLQYGSDFSGVSVIAYRSDKTLRYTTVTGKDGSFRIDACLPGPYTVQFFRADYGMIEQRITVSVGTDCYLPEFVFKANSGMLVGRITLDRSVPLENTSVQIMHESGTVRNTLTDGTGYYTFDSCVPGSYTITVSRDGFDTITASNVIVVGDHTADFSNLMKANTGDIKLTLNFEGGSVPPSAQVKITHESGKTWAGAIESVNKVNCIDCAEGHYVIDITADKFAPVKVELDVFRNTPAERIIEIRRSVGSIEGTVLIGGELIDTTIYNGVTITLVNEAVPSLRYTVNTTDGSFSKADVEAGNYTVEAKLSGYITARREHVEVVSSEVNTVSGALILLADGGGISGKVTLQYGSDFSGITVTATKSDNTIKYSTSTDVSGVFSIENMVPGQYTVEYEKTQYGSTSRTVLVRHGKNTPVSFQLQTTLSTIEGTVSLDKGSDLAGINVLLKHENGSTTNVVTDQYGKYRIDNVVPGSYSITFEKSGYDVAVISKAVVNPGQTKAFNIRLEYNQGAISGTLTFPETVPTGIELSVVHADGTGYPVSVTEEGLYSIPACKEGRYTVTVTVSGFFTETFDVSVVRNKTASHVTVMRKAFGSVSGTATLAGAMSSEGIKVTLTPTTGAKALVTTTISDGSYSFAGVHQGTYMLSFSKYGFEEHSEQIFVEAEKAYTINCTMPVALGTISGRVSLAGATEYGDVLITAKQVSGEKKEYTANSKPDGSFNISGITDEGMYQIFYSKEGYREDSSIQIELKFGKIAVVDPIELKSISSTVIGSITLEGSGDHSGITVKIESTNKLVSKETVTDSLGNFRFTGIAPGEYTITGAKAGYSSNTSYSFTVSPSSECDRGHMFSMSIGSDYMYGYASLSGANNYRGIIVSAVNQAFPDKVYTSTTTNNGMYTFIGLVPGTYRFTYTMNNYMTYTVEEHVITESDYYGSLPRVTLERNQGIVCGYATLEGATDHSGISIKMLDTGTTTTTDSNGYYTMKVPQGIHNGGISMTKSGYAETAYRGVVNVVVDSEARVDAIELKATHTAISGKVDILGEYSDSGVTVSIDGTDISTVSDYYGDYRLNSVPLEPNRYTLRFTRDGAATVTREIVLKRVPVNQMELVKIVPNSAVVTGAVHLDGLTQHGGITVTATPSPSGDVRTATTDSSGVFMISNLDTALSYDVTFSKDGWDSQSVAVSDLKPMEERNITDGMAVILKDTTAPVISAVILNGGVNTTAEVDVTAEIEAVEQGSGIAKMQYTFNGVFDEFVRVRDYANPFTLTLIKDNKPQTVTLRVQDKAGNWSEPQTATITVAGYNPGISGILPDDKLHWTAENSPYIVKGNILVDEGKTLVIDPGVDVIFTGPYSIQVDGSMQANGTATERIKFYAEGEGINKWTGVRTGVSSSANAVLDNVDMKDMLYAFNGKIEFRNGTIVSDLTGMSQTSYKFIYVENGVIENAKINLKGYNYSSTSPFIKFLNSDLISSQILLDDCFNYHKVSIYVNDICRDAVISINNFDYDNDWDEIVQCSSALNTSISIKCKYSYQYSNVEIYNGQYCTIDADNIRSGKLSYSTLKNVESIYSTDVFYSNFINCDDVVVETGSQSNYRDLNCRKCYWGPVNTQEIKDKELLGDPNMSFIHDRYDNFNLCEVDFRGYMTAPIPNACYQAENFTPVDTSQDTDWFLGETTPRGGFVFYEDKYNQFDWDYMEAVVLDKQLPFGFYRTTESYSDNQMVGTGTAIGDGRSNTEKLVAAMGTEAYLQDSGSLKGEYAAHYVSELTYGGVSDWFLPSRDELQQVYKFESITGYPWSSSEYSADICYAPYGSTSTNTEYRYTDRPIVLVRTF